MPEDITLRTIQIDEKPLIYSLERKDVKNINLHVRKTEVYMYLPIWRFRQKR